MTSRCVSMGDPLKCGVNLVYAESSRQIGSIPFYLIQYHNQQHQHQKLWTDLQWSKLILSSGTSSYCIMSWRPDLCDWRTAFSIRGLYGELTNETAEQLGYRPIGVEVGSIIAFVIMFLCSLYPCMKNYVMNDMSDKKQLTIVTTGIW